MARPLIARKDGKCHDCFKVATTFDGLFCKECLWERLKLDNAIPPCSVHEQRGRQVSVHPNTLGGAAEGAMEERDDA